jgi:beta-N-acetylhexosaminidase
VRPLAGKARRRADAALTRLVRVPEPFDVEAGRARFAAALEGRA